MNHAGRPRGRLTFRWACKDAEDSLAALRLAPQPLQQRNQRLGSSGLAPGDTQVQRRDLVAASIRQRQELEREARANTDDRLGCDIVSINDGPGQRQIVSPRPLPPNRRVVDASACWKGLEDGRQRVGRNADAGVADLNLQAVRGFRDRTDLDADVPCAVNLTDSRFSTSWRRRRSSPMPPQRQGGIDAAAQAQPLAAASRGRHHRRLDAISTLKSCACNRSEPASMRAPVQDVLDQASRLLPLVADDPISLGAPIRVSPPWASQRLLAPVAVQRAAQPVARVGQESGSCGQRGRFRPAPVQPRPARLCCCRRRFIATRVCRVCSTSRQHG